MSNSRSYFPAPPPPAAPQLDSDLALAASVIGGVLAASLIACAVVLACRHRQVFGAEKPQKSSRPGDLRSVPRSTAMEDPMGAIVEVESEVAPELSRQSSEVQRQIEEAHFGRMSRCEPARPAAPPAPSPKKTPLTMDEKLQQKAAARIEAAVRGKAARAERARYLKAGGRPNSADFAAWRSDSAIEKKQTGPVRLKSIDASASTLPGMPPAPPSGAAVGSVGGADPYMAQRDFVTDAEPGNVVL